MNWKQSLKYGLTGIAGIALGIGGSFAYNHFTMPSEVRKEERVIEPKDFDIIGERKLDYAGFIDGNTFKYQHGASLKLGSRTVNGNVLEAKAGGHIFLFYDYGDIKDINLDADEFNPLNAKIERVFVKLNDGKSYTFSRENVNKETALGIRSAEILEKASDVYNNLLKKIFDDIKKTSERNKQEKLNKLEKEKQEELSKLPGTDIFSPLMNGRGSYRLTPPPVSNTP